MNSISRYFRLLAIFICIFIFVENVEAQVRKRTTSTSSKNKKEIKNNKEPKPTAYDRINGDLLFGNVGFFNGLYFSTKVSAGYDIINRFSAGGGLKLFYNQYAVQGPDPSLLDLGGFIYGRGKITNELYIQAEYSFMKYSSDPDGYTLRGRFEDVSVDFPLLGLGYMSGGDKWKFGIQLLYNFNEEARDLQGSPVEYWFGASYNF